MPAAPPSLVTWLFWPQPNKKSLKVLPAPMVSVSLLIKPAEKEVPEYADL